MKFVAIIGMEGKYKDLYDRTISVLKEYEAGKGGDAEVARQAGIAIQRMNRSSSIGGTPITFVPIKRPATANILDRI